ncbi:MAG: hypothetical protein JGK24_16200 [Microcoleus sp. PH2017_29_MFU_D_A]|uniref:hypothetical protein n=1 Tax=unclassified Microcoleus TaxID=2642155 RepID=UPI001E023433|nr:MULTISPECIES: hypothetical protein [unclassified Microcoleus]MCC3506433.1 hypothetical protein [Microcoleus sp. PH2017_19_SFW_U_A]MCC3513113.1 hypothetical protein [Microcoleus sp. PH2017_17_BER_D_A]TAE10688.1 MAG: hypothetical protein EAZ94_18120 [Oscillatoriales cyanobacterium]MCC3412737.1 hypothetical protein [Microcoleus sp. PH2017_02_FOX_O_A]MCC3456100.1 hypothetical protein [Microcoleus sp. PH2017_08_TRC_O_A]
MHRLKMGLLFVTVVSSFSFGSIARAGERWPVPENRGSCLVNQVCDTYNKNQDYQKPSNAWGIAGFYVNLTSPDSSAIIRWSARLCDGKEITGSKDISTSSTGQNYIDFPNRSFFAQGVCSFRFNVLDAKRYRDGGNQVDFLMNYDVDY